MRDSQAMRRLINSDWYRGLRAYACQTRKIPMWDLRQGENRAANFSNTHGGKRTCKTLGADVTGVTCDTEILDDPYDAKKVVKGSPKLIRKRMEEALDIYLNVLTSRLNHPTDSMRFLMMQRLERGDLSAYAIRAGYEHLCLPTEYDPDHPFVSNQWDWRTKRGELLNPQRGYDREWVEAYKADPRRRATYKAEQDQNPGKLLGTKFREEWFDNRYPGPPHLMVQKVDRVIISIDCAEKKGEKNDSTSITVWGWKETPIDAQHTRAAFAALAAAAGRQPLPPLPEAAAGVNRGKLYLLDRVNRKMEITELYATAKAVMLTWPTWGALLIEDKSNGTALIQLLRAEGVRNVIDSQPGNDSKEVRAKQSQVAMQARDLFFPEDEYAPWMPEYRKNHTDFPMGDDDDVDSTSQVVIWTSGLDEDDEDPTETINQLLREMQGLREEVAAWLPHSPTFLAACPARWSPRFRGS